MAQNFGALVNKQDNSLNVEIHFKDQGGLKQGQELAALKDRNIDFATVSLSDLGAPFDALFRPYLFQGYEHLRRVVENEDFWKPFCARISEVLEVEVLSVICIGGRQFATKELIVDAPENLKGRVFRVPPGEAWKHMAHAFGAIPKSIGIGEVVQALENGTVDVVENPLPGMQVYKIDTVATTITLSNHMTDLLLVVMSNQVPLSLEQKKIVRDAAKTAQIWHDPKRREAEDRMLKAYQLSHQVRLAHEQDFRDAVNNYYAEHVLLNEEQRLWVAQVQRL